tara:strand:+ start:2387 stop:4465 length:2079 start_codon:yes stop_codon:yes gene_type:complete
MKHRLENNNKNCIIYADNNISLHLRGLVMPNRGALHFGVFLIAFIMATSSAPLEQNEQNLPEVKEQREQFGPDEPTLEETCSSLTFEDMFQYSKAIFNIEVSSDWTSASVEAVGWVNGTLADDVRASLDEYVASVYPSGDDGWISTDEREGVRAIASECIEHTLTRIGMRDGSPHRGGEGTSWKNISWTEDEVLVEEWNLVPQDHSQVRECSGIGSTSDCVEVPVIPDSNRNCDTNIDDSDGIDECRMMLWLNATLTIDNIQSPDEFTLVMNASNLSNVIYNFKFPETQGLRLDMWEECEGRDVQVDMGDFAGIAPLRGTCVGDQSSTYEIIQNVDSTITYVVEPNMISWPVGEDLFADFTTASIPINNPPIWTDNAPSDDSWFPRKNGGNQIIANWQLIQTWFEDEAAISSSTLDCRGEDGLNLDTSDRDISMDVPRGEAGEITCEILDPSGQSTGNRTWNIGVPFQISTSSNELSDPHPITLTPTTGWPELIVDVGLTSDYGIISSTEGPYSLYLSEITVDLATANTFPGDIYVYTHVSGDGVFNLEAYHDLGITKTGSPPVIVVNSEGWDGDSWSMSGMFSDPDGEPVTFVHKIDGSAIGSISVSGNMWSTPSIDFSLWSEGIHTISVEGCDATDLCTEIIRDVNNSQIFEETIPIQPPTSQENRLPGIGLPGILLVTSAGLIYSRRRA